MKSLAIVAGPHFGAVMTLGDHRQVINELQKVIDDTQATLKRFEKSGLEDDMSEDYEKLLGILDDAVKQQREHTRVMLGMNDNFH